MTKSHAKSNKEKRIRANKRGSASQAIGTLEHNTDLFVLTYGQFSLIDALMAILNQTGPAHVCISTWTAAHAHLDRSAELLEAADILSMRLIVDRSFRTRQPKYFAHMQRIFGQDSVREIRTHAKFMLIRNDEWNIVVRTSMNLNENPRLENIEISDNREFADFFQAIVDDVFAEVAPGEARSADLELSSIPEQPAFALVDAAHIPVNRLNEVQTTHEIKD